MRNTEDGRTDRPGRRWGGPGWSVGRDPTGDLAIASREDERVQMEMPSADADTSLRLDDQLCFALYATTGAIVRAYRPLLADLGLTYPQYVVLMALWEGDDISVGDVGDRLGMPLSGLTPVLDRLERAELLERHRGSEDRRVVKVVLTDAGRALERQAAGAADAVRCRTRLSEGGIAELREQLKALTHVLDTQHP